jgi:hypothetical protein
MKVLGSSRIDHKRKLPPEPLLLQQFFWFSERVTFFFRECCATPDSLGVVPGFHSLSIVDQPNR